MFELARNRLLAVCAVVCLLLFSGLAKGGLSGYDDALYAHEAKEMLRSGNWHDVRFNGDLNFEYPPLFIWLSAASMSMFGVTDYAAKVPAALAGLGAILLVYGIAWELRRDAWFATWAMLVLASTQPFLKYATHAMTDVPFTFLITLAVYCYMKGLKRPVYFLWMGCAVGLALLTRSVLGALPLVIAAAHLLLAKRWKLLSFRYVVGGLLIAFALPMAWLGPQCARHGEALVDGHFAFLVGKVTAADGIGLLKFQVLPWLRELATYYWPWLPVAAAGAWYGRSERESALPLIWVVVVLAALTQTAIPYGRYLMPAFPAMAIVCAAAMERWIGERKRVACFGGAAGILLLAGCYRTVFPAAERGVDIRAVADVAERSSRPQDRLLLYTYGERRYDYQNQLLWYADRYTRQIVDMDVLVSLHTPGRVGVIDKASFAQMPGSEGLEVLAESELFYCYRVMELPGNG